MLFRLFRSVVGGKKIIKKKYDVEKQSHTLFHSQILVRLSSVSYNNAPPARVRAINSVLTNNTNIYPIIVVCAQFIV